MTSPADPMDVVRAYYRAVNDGDRAAVAALSAPDCKIEPADAPGHAGRVEVWRVAGIETGWGWVRAEWTDARGSGYSHFWIEDGLIRRQRTIRRNGPLRESFPDEAPRRNERLRESFPEGGGRKRLPESSVSRPVVGVGAVILTAEGQVVLVRRLHEPLAGQWSLPGGRLELGETLEAGVAREIHEETGLLVDVGDVIEVFDRILLDDEGRVQFHFVLVDYLCRPRGGRLLAGSDVDAVVAVDPAGIGALGVTEKARTVVRRALELQRDM